MKHRLNNVGLILVAISIPVAGMANELPNLEVISQNEMKQEVIQECISVVDEGMQEDIPVVDEVIQENEIPEEVREELCEEQEEKIIWEEVQHEDAYGSIGVRYEIAEKMAIPLYDAIGLGEEKIDFSYLPYSYDEIKNQFVEAIFQASNMDSNIGHTNASYYIVKDYIEVTISNSKGIEWFRLYPDKHCEIAYTNKAYMMSNYATFQNAIKQVLSEANQASTQVQKERIIHDYLVLNSKYDTRSNIPQISYTAYGLMVNHVGVCSGYAYSMKYLLNKVGIECEVVTGYGNGEAHGWNIVKIDGKYYYVDTTWDDPTPDVIGRVRYNYFNVTRERLARDHSWAPNYYPEANDTSYSMFYENKDTICLDNRLFYIKTNNNNAPTQWQLIQYDLKSKTEKVLVTRKDGMQALTLDKDNKKVNYITYYGEKCSVQLEETSDSGQTDGGQKTQIQNFILRFYDTCMGRKPDAGGLNYWVNELNTQNKSVKEVVSFFVHSPEITNKNLNNHDYLVILYRSFFDREPDEGGMRYWTKCLENGTYTRDQELRLFIYSKEFNKVCKDYNLKLE